MPCEVNVVELRADVSVPTTDKIRIALADDHPIFSCDSYHPPANDTNL